MANEPTKTGSASLITREAQVNPIVTCQLTPTRLAIIKNNHREPVLARMWRLGTLCLGGGNVQGYHRHGKHKSDLSKIKYGITIQFSDSTSGFISEKEGKQELEQVERGFWMSQQQLPNPLGKDVSGRFSALSTMPWPQELCEQVFIFLLI